MAKRPTAWKPGQSGNPKGRPPSKRALTELLKKAGSKRVQITLPDGTTKGVSGKHLLASMMWELTTTGKVTLPDGEERVVKDFNDWFAAVKFIYQHIDGPPPKELLHGGATEDGAIPIHLTWSNDANGDD